MDMIETYYYAWNVTGELLSVIPNNNSLVEQHDFI